LLLVGEAPGYRGARISGIPFTSERLLTGSGPAEATATIVHRVLADLGIQEDVLLWNVVPTHPGTETSNRCPTRAEVDAGLPFLRELARVRRTIAVGRLAHSVLGGPYVRHPSHGGAGAFGAAMQRLSLGRSTAGFLAVDGGRSAANLRSVSARRWWLIRRGSFAACVRVF